MKPLINFSAQAYSVFSMNLVSALCCQGSLSNIYGVPYIMQLHFQKLLPGIGIVSSVFMWYILKMHVFLIGG